MKSVAEQKVEQFFNNYPKRHYPKGQIIIFGGEDPEAIYFIKSGRVRQYDISYRGDEVIVNVFKFPAFFPMSWAINKSKNPYFFKTEDDCEILVAPSEDVMEFVKKNPDVMLDLLSRLYRGMDGILGRVVRLMSGTAKSRLYYELIIECRRFGDAQKDGSCKLSLTEGDLASRSGLSRETVSRVIHTLKQEAQIKVKSGNIYIIDLKKLEQKLGSEI